MDFRTHVVHAAPIGFNTRRDTWIARRSRSGSRGVEPQLVALLKSPHRNAQICALEALAFRRVDVTASLRPFVLGEDPAVTAAALRAARTGGPSVRPLVEYALTSPAPAIRDAAIETGLLLGFIAGGS